MACLENGEMISGKGEKQKPLGAKKAKGQKDKEKLVSEQKRDKKWEKTGVVKHVKTTSTTTKKDERRRGHGVKKVREHGRPPGPREKMKGRGREKN